MVELSKRTVDLLRLIKKPDIRTRVDCLFKTEAALYGPPTREVMERVRFSVIKLALQGPEALSSAEQLYRIDTRDLLMNAGFGSDIHAHETWYRSMMVK
jgi:hypothetical protein